MIYKNNVSWANLSAGISFYEKTFKYLEVPWLVPSEIMKITFDGNYRFKTELGDLIASGEQSFLHLQLNGNLPSGRYMTLTPCFRDEEETEFNFKQFMKLELYITDDVSLENLHSTIQLCRTFLKNIISIRSKKPIKVSIKEIQDGSFDLECLSIELGSYGIREYNGHKWIYGTGIAEPRVSQVVTLA